MSNPLSQFSNNNSMYQLYNKENIINSIEAQRWTINIINSVELTTREKETDNKRY